MLYREIMLTEIRVTVWSGSTINVIHNPTRRAFEKFFAERGSLRGLLSFDGDDLYLWDAGSAVHTNIMQELGLDRMECLSYRGGGVWWGPNIFDEETGLYKPAIQRVTPRKRPSPEDDDALLKQLGIDLDEAIEPARLYHGTSLWGLVGIFRNDSMSGSDSDGPYGTSFTRSKEVAEVFSLLAGRRVARDVAANVRRDPTQENFYKANDPLEWAEYAVNPDNGAQGAIVVFDRDRLARKFGRRLQPLAADVRRPRLEVEERILGDVRGVVACIVKVLVNNMAKFDRFEAVVVEIDPALASVFAKVRAKLSH